MEIFRPYIEGLAVIKPKVFEDSRGYFFESFNGRDFESAVGKVNFVQDNESKSSYGVVRGLHFQKPPFSQAKLIRVLEGRIEDVAVDLRKGSPTFGKYFKVELSSDNKLQFFIPKGFAHGFAVLSEKAVCAYKCDEYYSPEHEGSIRWNDPVINIDWGVPADKVIISMKDMAAPFFSETVTYF